MQPESRHLVVVPQSCSLLDLVVETNDIQRMSDERELLEFDQEYVLSDALPHRGSPDRMATCSVCGADSPAWPSSALTIVKRHHASQPLGHLVVYCPDHIAQAREWNTGGGDSARMGPICPNDNVAVPTGTMECDICGWTPTR